MEATLLIRRWLLLVAVLAAPFAAATAAATEISWSGFDRLERDLRLDPWQKRQFEIAVEATHKAGLAIGLGVLQAKTRLAQELLKDRPDPEALFRAQEEVVATSRPYISRCRDEWLRFYSMLDEDQLRIAKAFVEEKLRLIERVGQELQKYLGERLQ